MSTSSTQSESWPASDGSFQSSSQAFASSQLNATGTPPEAMWLLKAPTLVPVQSSPEHGPVPSLPTSIGLTARAIADALRTGWATGSAGRLALTAAGTKNTCEEAPFASTIRQR